VNSLENWSKRVQSLECQVVYFQPNLLRVLVPPEIVKDMALFGLNVEDYSIDPSKKDRLKDAEEEQIVNVKK